MRESYILCEQCDEPTTHPLWLRYEPLDGDYRPHCQECAIERDRTFIPENAILQAMIVCSVHQGALGVQR